MQRRDDVDEHVAGQALAVLAIGPPAEHAVRIEGALRGRALEPFPVDGVERRIGRHRLHPRADLVVGVPRRLELGDLAEQAVGNELLRLDDVRRARMLTADLEHLLRPFHGLEQQVALLDRVRHRLFAVDVLPGRDRIEARARVPVIGRGDDHRVDVLTIENAAVVARAQAVVAEQLAGALEMPVVARRGRHHLHVRHAQGGARVGQTLDTEPDDAEPHRLVRALSAEGAEERTGHDRTSGGRPRSGGEKTSAIVVVPGHPVTPGLAAGGRAAFQRLNENVRLGRLALRPGHERQPRDRAAATTAACARSAGRRSPPSSDGCRRAR